MDYDEVPEARLWRAVIEQTVKEALGMIVINDGGNSCITNSNKDRFKRESINWIERGNFEFRLVCGFAGVDPSYVRRKYKEYMKFKESNMESGLIIRRRVSHNDGRNHKKNNNNKKVFQ